MKIEYAGSNRFYKIRYVLSSVFAIGLLSKEEDEGTAVFYINFLGREWLWSIE
jgi:hypothetical protein